MRQRLRIWLYALAVIAGLLLLDTLPAPSNTLFWREFNNAGHAPFFGFLSLVFLGVLRLRMRDRSKSKKGQYLLAFVLSVTVGAIAEAIQYFTPRHADPRDLLYDAIGAVAFLAFYATLDREVSRQWREPGSRLKTAVRVVAVSLLMVTFLSPTLWAVSYFERKRSFPEICGFDSYWQNKYVTLEDASLQIVNPPPGWKSQAIDKVAELTLFPSRYPGLVVSEPFPDWSEYTIFCFEVFSLSEEPIKIGLRIHDLAHDHQNDDRFNREIMIYAGMNKVAIPIEEIRLAPATREMDLAEIAEFKLFSCNPKKKFTLYIDDFCLQ